MRRKYTVWLLVVFMLFVSSCRQMDQSVSDVSSDHDFLSEPFESSESYQPSESVIWSEEAYKVLSMIKEVLQNEREYFCAVYGRSIYLKDFHSISTLEDYETNEYDDDEDNDTIHVYLQFSVIDMDGDGIPELLLESKSGNKILVFHYEDGMVYGNVFQYRAMKFVKPDGTFESSDSAAYTVVGKLRFSKSEVFFTEVCLLDELYNVNNVYRINGKNVNREEAHSFYEEWRQNAAEWYEYNETNIDRYLDSP